MLAGNDSLDPAAAHDSGVRRESSRPHLPGWLESLLAEYPNGLLSRQLHVWIQGSVLCARPGRFARIFPSPVNLWQRRVVVLWVVGSLVALATACFQYACSQ